jgi:hypothetical protein
MRLREIPLDVQRDFADVCALLPVDYAALAVSHRAIQPNHVHARIKTADDLLRMILLHVAADLPLRKTTAVIAETGGPVVSPYCLHLRMRAAAPYLGALVASLLAPTEHGRVPESFDGYELLAVDGTAFSGRCATGTDARIHAAIRLSDFAVVGATAYGVEYGETYKHFMWKEGQLAIGDRGYCNGPGIAWVVDHGADVLVRLNRGSLVMFDPQDHPVDLFGWVRTISEGQVVERKVRITTTVARQKRTIEGRLVATRLPEAKAEEARQRAREELGAKTTAATLEMASYVVLFTTSTLTAERCLEVYRLRWQVELLFKRWKSLCHFDKLPNERPDTILSWVTAKLLLGLLVDRLAGPADEDVFPSASRPIVDTAA